MPNRVGGMDYFYWLFDTECKKLNYQITWLFPNVQDFDNYTELNKLCPKENQSIEACFSCQFSISPSSLCTHGPKKPPPAQHKIQKGLLQS